VTGPLPADGPFDGILHFASPASPVDYQRLPVETLQAGSVGTLRLLERAREAAARFLLASTSEVYGDPREHPQTEEYWGHVNPVGPRSVYDEAKRFAEAATTAYGRVHGVDSRIARIFNTYGPRMRVADGRVVSNFVCQALRGEALTLYGDGSQTRAFCYVDDLVEGLWRLYHHEGPLLVNLGSPEEFTIRALADQIQRLTGAQVETRSMALPEDDPRMRRPDLSRARTELGWAPSVSLEEGLRRTIDDFRSRLGGSR
jgi:dTDP-glucose 4,6-dehydratase